MIPLAEGSGVGASRYHLNIAYIKVNAVAVGSVRLLLDILFGIVYN